MLSPAKLLALSNRVYCLLLYLYPVSFRREYGYDMAQLFRDDVRGTMQESGGVAVVGLWFLAFFDLLKTAVAEHFWEIFHMPIEKLTRWSGLAAALGGALFVFIMYFEVPVNENSLFLWILLPMLLLWGVALTGLYRRLPDRSSTGNKMTFGLALISLLLLGAGAFTFWLSDPDLPWYLLGIGFYGLAIGIIGMGIIALKHQVLGVWRFVPLILGGVFLGFMVIATIAQQLSLAFLILNGIGWLLLGMALWQEYREPLEPGLFA